jgi:hypothetical protein
MALHALVIPMRLGFSNRMRLGSEAERTDQALTRPGYPGRQQQQQWQLAAAGVTTTAAATEVAALSAEAGSAGFCCWCCRCHICYRCSSHCIGQCEGCSTSGAEVLGCYQQQQQLLLLLLLPILLLLLLGSSWQLLLSCVGSGCISCCSGFF